MIRTGSKLASIKAAWNSFYRAAPRPRACPRCGAGRISFDGSRTRAASVLADEGVGYLKSVLCRRVRCGACRVSWTVRPPGLSANRHYQLCVVASAVSAYLFGPGTTQAAVAQRYDCSARAVGRWVRWVSQIANPEALQRALLNLLGQPILAPIGAVTDIARKARNAARRELLTRSATVLSLLEALGAASGLEPPGLRSMVERAVGSFPRLGTLARPLIPEFAR